MLRFRPGRERAMAPVGLYTHIRSNRIKTAVVLLFFPILLPALVFSILLVVIVATGHPIDRAAGAAGVYAVMTGFAVVPVMVGWVPIAYLINQWMIDRATGSRPVTRAEETRTWNLLENLCISRGLTIPALRIIEAGELNAFASGVSQRSYCITVTRGLLNELNDDELEGVLAHELTHIMNEDVKLLIATGLIAGVAPLACDVLLLAWRAFIWFLSLPIRFLALVLPGFDAVFALFTAVHTGVVAIAAAALRFISEIFSLFLNMFLSRRREYMADAGAIDLTKNPDALISALKKISQNSDLPTNIASIREMYFDNPRLSGFAGLFATHPPVSKRIDALIVYCRDVAPKEVLRAVSPSLAIPVRSIVQRRLNANYSEFLVKHVGQLGVNNMATRKNLYKRVGDLLWEQLAAMNPPLSQEEVDLEYKALNEAIDNIESAYKAPEVRI
jgi:heat shock protein HtpX